MEHLDLNVNDYDTSDYVDKTWVQCETPNCLKWRLVPKDDSKLDLDRPWYCHMNPDPLFSHCTIPQVPFPKDTLLQERGLKVVYSQLPAGSLVLVKASTWPWWPAILSIDPASEDYARHDSEGHVEKYHVEFLGSPHSRFWASVKRVELYRASNAKPKNLRGVLKRSYEVAVEEALKIQDKGCEERLLMCHFKPEELFCKARRLMNSIEKMISQCNSVSTSNQHGSKVNKKSHGKANQELCDASIVEIGDSLIIEGFRFESAICAEDLVPSFPLSQPVHKAITRQTSKTSNGSQKRSKGSSRRLNYTMLLYSLLEKHNIEPE